MKKLFTVLLAAVLLSGCTSGPLTEDHLSAPGISGAGADNLPAAENKTDEKKTEPVWQDEQTEEYAGDNKAATENDAPVTGEFIAVAPTGNNRGPVRVVEKTALAWADGTPH